MERQIIHIDINSFAVSVERIKDSSLRDRPIVVAYPTMDRSLVYTASPEARSNGIRPGMSLNLARKLCREITVVPPNLALYERAMRAIHAILHEFSPIIEPVGYGRAYLDMTGTERLFGVTRDAAHKLQREIILRLRLHSTAGVASNKLVSKIASSVIRPVSLQDVVTGAEEGFIAPFNVHYLPAITQKVEQQLLDLNIRIIRDLAGLSLTHLTTVFGRTGMQLYHASHGVDKTPVQPPLRIPMLTEECTLADDSNDFDRLRGELLRLIERGTLRLRQSERTTQKFFLEIEYSDHRKAYGQKKLAQPVNMDRELFQHADALMRKIIVRRTRIRKITIRFAALAPAVKQISLFSSIQEKQNVRLTEAIDRIRMKFGPGAIQTAMGKAAWRALNTVI